MTHAQTILLLRAANWACQTERTPGQLHAYLAALDVCAEIAGDENPLDGAIEYAEALFALPPVKRLKACARVALILMQHTNDLDGWKVTDVELLPELPRPR